jgi:uncharacterized membrane protein YfcA
MPFEIAIAAASLLAGAVASVSGFGIGSILTPLVSVKLGTKVAVAFVSVPHFGGTLLRFFLLRSHVDRRVLLSFGLTSAAGGLLGAFLHTRLSSPWLTLVFAALLLFAGTMGLTGLSERMRFGHTSAWVAGAISGAFGGLVGNQGGIRSAALLGFALSRETFVATATATGLIVDLVRMPIYFRAEAPRVLEWWPALGIALVFVIAGTLLGAGALRRIPDTIYKKSVSLLVLILGLFMAYRSL